MNSFNHKSILNNIELVFKTCDINKLNGTAYKFVSLMSGFIAHYDISGFKAHYSKVEDLLNDIKDSMDLADTERYINDSFFSTGESAGYYKSKYDTLIGLKELVSKYSVSVQKHANEQDDYRWDVLKESVRRAETDVDMRQRLVTALFE